MKPPGRERERDRLEGREREGKRQRVQEGELSVVVRGGLNNLGGAGELLHLETNR